MPQRNAHVDKFREGGGGVVMGCAKFLQKILMGAT